MYDMMMMMRWLVVSLVTLLFCCCGMTTILLAGTEQEHGSVFLILYSLAHQRNIAGVSQVVLFGEVTNRHDWLWERANSLKPVWLERNLSSCSHCSWFVFSPIEKTGHDGTLKKFHLFSPRKHIKARWRDYYHIYLIVPMEIYTLYVEVKAPLHLMASY